MKRFLRWTGFLLALLIAFGAGYSWPILVRGPFMIGQDAISEAATVGVTPVIEDAGGRVIVIRPPMGTSERDVLVVLYPGGLVRPQAYEWLGRALAVRGYTTIIPEFSFDLAVTGTDRATTLIERYGQGKKVVLAGHSLGGAMAAQYLADQLKAGRNPAAGLVLLAAYPPDGADLSTAKLSAISLRGEFDRVADGAKVKAGLDLLPDDTRLVTITGGVHAFFGRYGPQAGDGTPGVSRADAERQIIEVVSGFLSQF